MNKAQHTKWYAFVPNLITLLNLVSGCVGIYFAFEGELRIAVLLMLAGSVFDFFDGFAARLLKVSGELGKQLDSLSDLATFGILPGVLVFTMQGITINKGFEFYSFLDWALLSVSILIPVFSALRLAKFNIDTRQTSSFIGLPTPANALFIASLAWAYSTNTNFVATLSHSAFILAGLCLLFCALLVSELPLFALKFSNYSIKDNSKRYLFLAVSIILLALFGLAGFSLVIVWYVLISVAK